jgi:molybdate transport system substrate-binding protein
MKLFLKFMCCVLLVLPLGTCTNKKSTATESVTILLAAAASLENAFVQQIIPKFNEKYPNIFVEGTYDSSGKLQTQIENGLAADVFMSASVKQMDALVAGGYINEADVIKLLQNQIVLIKKKGSSVTVTSFNDAANAASIAIGDPASVPAGQYAAEAFTKLGNWDAVNAKSSLGTNVTEVLSWVASGSAEVGVVYATDAASNGGVEVIAELPRGVLSSSVIYPISVTTESAKEAKLFVDYVASQDGLDIFEEFGFSQN